MVTTDLLENNFLRNLLTSTRNKFQAFPESDCHTDVARMAWSDLRQELEAVCPRLDPRTLDSLLKSRAVVLGRAFHYYRSAASAYFKYLQLQQQQVPVIC